MAYNKIEETNKNNDKNQNNCKLFCPNLSCYNGCGFFCVFRAIFNAILLEKSVIAFPENQTFITTFKFKNLTQEQDFIKLRYYANSVYTCNAFISKLNNMKMRCAILFWTSLYDFLFLKKIFLFQITFSFSKQVFSNFFFKTIFIFKDVFFSNKSFFPEQRFFTQTIFTLIKRLISLKLFI